MSSLIKSMKHGRRLLVHPQVWAKTALSALGHKLIVVSGLLNKTYAWEKRFIPRSWPVNLFDFLINRAIKAFQSKQSTAAIVASSVH